MNNSDTPAVLNGRSFRKMHGLGNDFVILDARVRPLTPSPAQIARLADRRRGIGCDQLIVIEPGDAEAEAFMRIFNADGGQVSACGNATRCVARLLMEESGRGETTLRTRAGLIRVIAAGGDAITANMGEAWLKWDEIPLAEAHDTLSLPISVGGLETPVGVSMGNPHAVFFVPDAEAIALTKLGPLIEAHPLFPEKTNVEVVHLIAPNTLRMRVWERGVGITQACGTGACATLVAAARRGITGSIGTVVLDGGDLRITWADNGHVLMTGPASLSFDGVIGDLDEIA